MTRIFLFLFICFIATLSVAQSTLHITGEYLDKQNNPLDNASIEYLLWGTNSIGSTISSIDGSFDLLINLTSIEKADEIITQSAFPNPFNEHTSLSVNVPEKGKVIITDLYGTIVNSAELSSQGVYLISWGGENANGQQLSQGTYFMSISGNGYSSSQKLLYHQSENSDGLNISLVEKGTYKSIKTDDIIRFTRDNTTILEVPVILPSSDTTLGIIIGNHGPANLETLVASIHIDSLESWNINNYFYNDDQSLYEVIELGFSITADSLMIYSGGQAGTFIFDINAKDIFDPILSDVMVSQVTITNTQYFSLSGVYVDQQLNPIENAQVRYIQNGNVILESTFTENNGYFELDMVVDPDGDKSSDKLRLIKNNTSLIEILFNTPSQDTVINVFGNLGPIAYYNISDTIFTIYPYREWNLNDYFSNDDQSEYLINSSQFILSEDTTMVFFQSEEGFYETTVTATDTADNTLQASFTANVEVLYTLLITDFELIEDAELDTLITDISSLSNPIYPNPLTYEIVSQSNEDLISLNLENNSVLIDFLQPDGFGLSTIGIKIADGELIDTVYFNIAVLSRPDIYGNIIDLFDSTMVSFAVVEIEEDGFMHVDSSNEIGYYHIQLNDNVDSVSYLPATIRHEDYTPFHSWATIYPDSSDCDIDYKIIFEDYKWEFYYMTFSDGVLNWPDPFYMTYHWVEPPLIHIWDDNSLVSGFDIAEHFNNALINLDSILPTFNPIEALPENVVPHTEGFGYIIQNGEMAVYWDNSIIGGGTWWCICSGPVKIKCTVVFKESIGIGGPANGAMSQEFGSVMGAKLEPPQSPNYSSVFCDPPNSNSFTEDDYMAAHIYLSRSLMHAYNAEFEFPDPEGYDWELRPDIVKQYYPDTGNYSKMDLSLVMKTYTKNGEIKIISYDYDSIPSSIMKQDPVLFSPKEIKQRENQEKKAIRKAKRQGLVYQPPQPIIIETFPSQRSNTKPVIVENNGFDKMMKQLIIESNNKSYELPTQRQPFEFENNNGFEYLLKK